ncbi:hypothetical protein ACIRQY_12630 [Streptomyces sp. NPDC101490]|uniref:hypothetical protein n=1 Tax=Streptomyces sp. NPDC101490 TaxID=3366143 RepID=UPI00381D2B7C
MEQQSTGPSTQPLPGASADPGFIPGIMAAPVPVVTPKAEEEPPEDARPAAADAPAEAESEPGPGPGPADAEADTDADEPAEEEPEDAAPEAADGPVFEAADRRGRIVADADGVRLSYDEEACEFRWDEINAVESETKRFGRRFLVTVHTPGPRWYPIEIIAPDRNQLPVWEKELDAALDAYFEDEAEDGE